MYSLTHILSPPSEGSDFIFHHHERGNAIKHPILTCAKTCCDQTLSEHLSSPHVSLSNRHQQQQSKLWTQLKAPQTSYIKPCSCLPHHVNPTNNTPRVHPTSSFIISGITWTDQYIGELWCKRYHVQILHTKPPTSPQGQRQLCLKLYLPCSTCPKMLCVFVCTSF